MITRDPDVTRLIDRLVRAGLAQRARAASDRRVVEVGITEAGLDVLSRLDHDTAGDLLGGLGSERLGTLRDLLGDVILAVNGATAAADASTARRADSREQHTPAQGAEP
jgi:hypothetical protein